MKLTPSLRAALKKRGIKIPAQKKPTYNYEGKLAAQLTANGLPRPQLEYRWLEGRKYRADLAYPPKLIIEIEGAAHRIKGRFNDDILKSQAAVTAGVWMLRIATSQVRSGEAVDVVRRALDRVNA